MSDALFTTAEVAEKLRIPPATLRWWRHVDRGPKSFKVGRRVVYRASEVDAYLATCEANTLAGGAQ